MKTFNIITRVFSILTAILALVLFIFFNKSEGELIGSTMSVLISSTAIFLVTYIPKFLSDRNITISKPMFAIILLSFIFSMGGGFIFRFYVIFNYYDTIIHFINGAILVIVAFVIVYYYAEDPEKHTTPIILISVLAAISLGTIWEIYEFLVDSIFSGSNMQRFQDVKTGIDFVGQRALRDTMVDLIVDTLGAILGGLFLYMDSISKRQFINSIILIETIE